MTDQADIERKFWKALRSDMTVMLGVDGEGSDGPRPMTAQIDGDEDQGPLYFFTAKDTSLVTALTNDMTPATLTFVAKGHDVWATVTGWLTIHQDRATIDRLWNPFVAAWYEGGKDDPNLCLLKMDLDEAKIWLDGSSLMAGIKMLLGMDPKDDYEGKVAKVSKL
jgi:general stress protein 26